MAPDAPHDRLAPSADLAAEESVLSEHLLDGEALG
jgi:hypothetical protein